MQVFKSNDTIEGYRVMSEIGRGAASVVYLVQDPKTKQIWALKLVEKTADAKMVGNKITTQIGANAVVFARMN